MFLLYVSEPWRLIKTAWDAGEFLKSWCQGPKPVALKSLGDGTIVAWFFLNSPGDSSVYLVYISFILCPFFVSSDSWDV